MSGALLRSGALRQFFALGAVGHPVYESAAQLRIAIRSQIGADVADTFAIPKRNDSGDVVDWYAPSDGEVVPWASATEEERASGLRALQGMRERILAAGLRLRAESDNERQVFGRLLQHVMTFPDDQHVYLVDGKPVLTFWGFRRHDAPVAVDSLALLPGAVAAHRPMNPIVDTDDTPVVERRSWWDRRWPWWLWVLLLSLLLIPLLFLFRSCSEVPKVGLPSLEGPGMPRSATPDMQQIPDDPLGRQPLGAVGREAELQPSAGHGAPADATDAVPSAQPAPEEDSALPPATEAPPQPPLNEQLPPDDEARSEPPAPPVPETPPGLRDSPGQSPPLQIPPDALQEGNVDFLNGRWNSNSGLMDETGRPVQLEYDFENGEGSVSVRRSDGSVCSGNTSAGIAQQRLVITDRGHIRCPDGQFFEPSTVDCSVGEGGRANCNGRYATGGAFPVEIRQAE